MLVEIVRAEDARRFDKTLENLLANPNEKVRIRAALAVGRIGDESAIPALAKLLRTDSSNEARAMAAFALGEIESVKAAQVIIEVLNNQNNRNEIRARAVEAAGKIAAANSKDEKSKELGETVLRSLDYEDKKGSAAANRDVVLLGLTAVLRARPADAEKIVVKFLAYPDARVRADALNTLARLRAKNANEKTRELLQKDTDAVVRANAARVLGGAEDKAALDLLLNAATGDRDLRVRVSAIRSLGNLKDAKSARKLLERTESLLVDYKNSKFASPTEKNELLEIATTFSRILPRTSDKALPNPDYERAISLLLSLLQTPEVTSPEIHIALARIAPSVYYRRVPASSKSFKSWQEISAWAQGLNEFSTIEEKSQDGWLRGQASNFLRGLIKRSTQSQAEMKAISKAIPDVLRSFATFKTDDLGQVLRENIKNDDVIVRATAAELLGEQPASKENIEVLKTAFTEALVKDTKLNDAQLAILSALVKLDKKAATGSLLLALNAPDYLLRRQALQLIKQNNLQPGFPDIRNLDVKFGRVASYTTAPKSKLGVILNTNADYLRAVTRKSAKAIITTGKGAFAIEFYPEDAPLTVDNFIRLARSGYFNNVAIHRVVPNFVMQDGDPRGDGNGGPGWEIRCEINMIPYERGAVGMALSGKDTGGSQWFVTHSPQPHLDGGYTVFGRVNESDMKIVDNLVRGDKILSVRIIEGNSMPKNTRRKPAR